MDINNIWQFELRKGNSNNPKDGACLLDAVSWFEYGTLGDHPRGGPGCGNEGDTGRTEMIEL